MTESMIEHIAHSNRIEGVTDPDEIGRSLYAWEALVAEKKLTLDVVLDCHRSVMSKLLPAEAGRLRTGWVRVGGRTCPSPTDAAYLLNVWLSDMGNWITWHPRHMHVRFEHIHPFIDGNGRVGRMLMWWHEIKLGRRPTLIRYEDRWAYYDWFNDD